MSKKFKEDIVDISERLIKPQDLLSKENLTSQSSKVATLCAVGEVVSTGLGFPGVGTAIGCAIGFFLQ